MELLTMKNFLQLIGKSVNIIQINASLSEFLCDKMIVIAMFTDYNILYNTPSNKEKTI